MKSATNKVVTASHEAPVETGTRTGAVQGAVALGALVAPVGDGRWRVRVGGVEREAAVDASVDPALLDDAAAQGARALLDAGEGLVIVGVVLTARPVSHARDGSVTVRAPRVVVEAASEALVKTPWSFLRLNQSEVEIAGVKVLTRAREVAKILARVIALN